MGPGADPWLAASVAGDVAWSTHASAVALKRQRDLRLAALLDAARPSPLYRPLLEGRAAGEVALQELPVARKAALMSRFDDWVADPRLRLDALRAFVQRPEAIGTLYEGRYVVWESSGSSGEPALFVQDPRAMAVYDALEALRRPARRPLQRLLDPFGLGERIAFVGATGGHFASVVMVERLRRLNPLFAQAMRSLSFLQPLPQLVQGLDRFAPTVIASYPSAAALLADEHAAGRLRTAPREVWTGGETLTPALRRHVEQAFGCPVTNSYGASEFLTLAFDCAHGRLHLNADWVILEPVDEQGRAVHGAMGATTLLTNLANHVQPLIRYDLGDRVQLHEEGCACGSGLPWLEVLGRSDDMLSVGPRGRAVRLPPLALTTVLEDEAGLFDFELVQRAPDLLELATGLAGAGGRDALRRGKHALAGYLAAQGAGGVRIRCREGVHGTPGRSGKTQRVRCALPGHGAGGV